MRMLGLRKLEGGGVKHPPPSPFRGKGVSEAKPEVKALRLDFSESMPQILIF